MTRETAIDKIRKLLSLGKSPNPHEATLALPMANEIALRHFEIAVIASGSFLDADPGYGGKTYRVETCTIRLNPIALDAYLSCQMNLDIEDFGSHEEYEEYEAKKQLKKISFEKKVAEMLGFDQKMAHVHIQQIVSEVFGVSYITEEK